MSPTSTPRKLPRADFDLLLEALAERGYEVIGPRATTAAIELGPITAAEELPIGITDEQDGGTYRLTDAGDGALFGFSTGPQSWKRYLHPPTLSLWRSRREPNGELSFESEESEPP